MKAIGIILGTVGASCLALSMSFAQMKPPAHPGYPGKWSENSDVGGTQHERCDVSLRQNYRDAPGGRSGGRVAGRDITRRVRTKRLPGPTIRRVGGIDQ